MELYYEVHAGTGPYLLLVHGFLSSRAQWRLNLAALARVSRPVVVELWGHSHSPSPDDPALYAPDTYMQLFDQLRQRLGVARWLLCGQSLGAALTLRYALTYPDRVIAQVFTNSAAALADAAWVQSRRESAIQQAEAIERDGAAASNACVCIPSMPTGCRPTSGRRCWLMPNCTARAVLPRPCATPPPMCRYASASATCVCPPCWCAVSVKSVLLLIGPLRNARSRLCRWSAHRLDMP